jgi:hypothetical protein
MCGLAVPSLKKWKTTLSCGLKGRSHTICLQGSWLWLRGNAVARSTEQAVREREGRGNDGKRRGCHQPAGDPPREAAKPAKKKVALP